MAVNSPPGIVEVMQVPNEGLAQPLVADGILGGLLLISGTLLQGHVLALSRVQGGCWRCCCGGVAQPRLLLLLLALAMGLQV